MQKLRSLKPREHLAVKSKYEKAGSHRPFFDDVMQAANSMTVKKIAGVAASWLVVISLSYVALELTVLAWLPKVFPLASVMNYLAPDVQLLAQYSKKNIIPEDYIAILGDSYASGQGDWLFDRQSDIAPVYNTTHLLHQKTGRDVVSFGRPASSSIKAYLEDPVSQMRFIRTRFPLADPAIAVLYFYEGNDVVDNWQEYQVRYLGQGFDAAQLTDPQSFSDFIDRGILEKNKTIKLISMRSIESKFFLGRFMFSLAVNESAHFYLHLQQKINPKPHRPVFKPQPRNHNTVLIHGEESRIPDGLQVPPVALQESEIAISMTMLDQSLRQLKRRWPNTKLGMVYVPAVGTSYAVTSETVNIYDTDRGKNYPTTRLLPVSDEICQRVRKIALGNGVFFEDARSAIRAAAQQEFLHGPVDWLHFNEKGYRILSGEIEKLLGNIQSSDLLLDADCASLAVQ